MNRDRGALAASAAVIVLMAYPAGALLLRSLRDDAGAGTLVHWTSLLGSRSMQAALLRTLWLSAAAALLAIAAASIMALLSARAAFPGRGLLRLSALGPAAMSQTLTAIAWVVLADPGAGLLNAGARRLGLGSPFDVFTPGGLILVMAAVCLPTAYLLAEALFLTSSEELEDAARVCGASPARAWLSTTFPDAIPGLAAAGLLCFCQAMMMFSVQGVIALPANLQTVTTLVYTRYSLGFSDAGDNAALSLLMMGLALAALGVQQALSARAAALARARPSPPRSIRLSGAKAWGAASAALLALLALLVLPAATLAARSLAPFGAWSGAPLSLDAYRLALSDAALLRGLAHSLLLGAAAAAACSALAFPAARLVFRSRSALRGPTQASAIAPLGWSGLLLAAAYLSAFARTPVYGTLWLLLAVLIARELPIAFKAAEEGLGRVASELEAQAYVCGADGGEVSREILSPLCRATRAAGAAVVFLAAFREIEASSLLAGYGRESFGYNVFSLLQSGRYQELGAIALIGTAACLTACAPLLYFAQREARRGGARA